MQTITIDNIDYKAVNVVSAVMQLGYKRNDIADIYRTYTTDNTIKKYCIHLNGRTTVYNDAVATGINILFAEIKIPDK